MEGVATEGITTPLRKDPHTVKLMWAVETVETTRVCSALSCVDTFHVRTIMVEENCNQTTCDPYYIRCFISDDIIDFLKDTSYGLMDENVHKRAYNVMRITVMGAYLVPLLASVLICLAISVTVRVLCCIFYEFMIWAYQRAAQPSAQSAAQPSAQLPNPQPSLLPSPIQPAVLTTHAQPGQFENVGGGNRYYMRNRS